MLKRTVTMLSVLAAVSTLLVTGCGRTPVDPLAPGDKPAAEEPGEEPEDPGSEDPFEPDPGPGTGGGSTGGSTGGGSTGGSTGGGAVTKPASTLKPIARPTPIPVQKEEAGGAPDKSAQIEQFMSLLQRFGYDESVSAFDVRTQLQPLTRVPNNWFKWVDSQQLGLLYGNRKAGMGNPTYQQWQEAGLALARRGSPITFYVARKPLYRDILTNWYQPENPKELTFYKRLNNTNFMVCYTARGEVRDYGAFAIDWRQFIEVPAAVWK